MPPYPRAISTGVSGWCAYIYWLDQSARASVALQTGETNRVQRCCSEEGGTEGRRQGGKEGRKSRLNWTTYKKKLINLGRGGRKKKGPAAPRHLLDPVFARSRSCDHRDTSVMSSAEQRR